ncbi:MAG: hypothetical protein J6Q35_07685 [Rikenellaceae bacterium]|nr:hypothetical protein [Rikenellaceae bacterium]
MKNEIYLKAGRVELSREEVQAFVESNRVYIVVYRDIYFIDWCNNTGRYYARKIYTKYEDLPLTKRGRFFAYKAKWVNDLLGFQLLAE